MEPTLAQVREARDRIAPHVRRTPMITATLAGKRVHLKLEHLQRGGSFKARGAFNALLSSLGARPEEVVTASGGNHGLGVAVAAHALGLPSTVFLPEKAPRSSEKRLQALGARVVRGGTAWDDAWALAREHASRTGALLVHPFEDPAVIAGQGSVGLEIREQVPDADLVVVAIGGGGLIAGVGVALGGVRLVGVEPVGATSMLQSLQAGKVVRLDSVKTIAGTLAPLAPGPRTLELASESVDTVVLVSDEEMLAAMKLLWEELRVLVEPAGAAALAAFLAGRTGEAKEPVVLVCGANLDEELAATTVRA